MSCIKSVEVNVEDSMVESGTVGEVTANDVGNCWRGDCQ